MADYTIELRPKRGQVELVLNMLSDVGVTEHCDGRLTVAPAIDKPAPTWKDI